MPKNTYTINFEAVIPFSGKIRVTADSKEEAMDQYRSDVKSTIFELSSIPEDMTIDVVDYPIELTTGDVAIHYFTVYYKTPNYQRFALDMENAGISFEDYKGRNSYNGPAVRCDHYSDVMCKTSVPCIFDSMGLGFIVYPR